LKFKTFNDDVGEDLDSQPDLLLDKSLWEDMGRDGMKHVEKSQTA
jgi:hypothetical protein